MSTARTVLLINKPLSSKPSCPDERGLLCNNIKVCHVCRICMHLELHSPTLPLGVSTVKIRDSNGASRVQPTCHRGSQSFSLLPLDHEFTGRRDKLHPEQLTRIPLNGVAANILTVAANFALPRLRYHDSTCAVVKGMKRNVGFGTRMASRDVRVRRCQRQRACATAVST